MPIVPSGAPGIHDLVEQLSSPRPATRDRAVARLTLLGARAVAPLVAALPSTPPAARAAALEVLERLDDARVQPALELLARDPADAVATRAVELLGTRGEAASVPALALALGRGRGPVRRAAATALAHLHRRGVVVALAPLVDVLLDETAEVARRLEILDLVCALEPPLARATLRPLARRLATSPVAAVARGGARLVAPSPAARESGGPGDPVARLESSGGATRQDVEDALRAIRRMDPLPLERLRAALEGAREPRVIEAVAALLGELGDAASIPALARAVARLSSGGVTEAGVGARAAIHTALARLDSRIALHDLRDLVALRPRPALSALLAAVERVGDPSLVPALARAATEEPSLAEPCARAYASIARRHRLRRTSAALRKVRPEHRPALEKFLAPRRRR